MSNVNQILKKEFILTIIIIIISSVSIKAQANMDGAEVIILSGDNNYLITETNEKIVFYGNKILLSEQHVFYWDSNNKRNTIKQGKLKSLVVGDFRYMTLAVNNSMNRLHEIIGFNKQYVVTNYPGYLYVWDREFNLIEDRVSIRVYNNKLIIKAKEEIKERVAKYFKDCPGFLDALFKNIDEENYPCSGISNYNCNNSTNIID